MEKSNLIIYLACIILIFILGKILIVPFKKIIKLIFNSILGGILIYVINLIGETFNFHIGLNVITSVFIGLFGVPGVALLIFIKIFII